jgi:RNA polymerase Rpc34 subunit
MQSGRIRSTKQREMQTRPCVFIDTDPSPLSLILPFISWVRGVWTRDIKLSTNIPQHTLTKTLKILEQRNLIKSVRSVVSKSKKLYMLYDVVPAKEITGNYINLVLLWIFCITHLLAYYFS